MSTRTPDAAAPFFDVADPAFSVTSAEVRRARQAGWYARTSYGLAVLRYDQVSRLIRHPALRQGSRLWPAHHGITSGPFADWWASWVLNLEGEAHHRMRRLLSPAFSRRIVEALRPRFTDLAGELADSFAGTGRCEFMGSVTRVPRARQPGFLIAGIPGPFGSQSPSPPTSRPGFTEINSSDAEVYSGCSCHLCRLLACCRTRRRHLGM